MRESDSVTQGNSLPDQTLEFEFGAVSIDLRTLRTMSVGYVFETMSRIDRPVILRCNGATVGRGQLMVDEHGSLVVQVTESK